MSVCPHGKQVSTVESGDAAENPSDWMPELLSDAELSARSTSLWLGAKREMPSPLGCRPVPTPDCVTAPPPAWLCDAGAGTKSKKARGGTLGLAELRGRNAGSGPASGVPQGAAPGAMQGVTVRFCCEGFVSNASP